MKDIIKRQTYGGRTVVTGIRIDGVTKLLSEWVAMPEVEVTLSGLRKRIKANTRTKEDNTARLTVKEMVFLPSRGNGSTGETDRVKTKLWNKRFFDIENSVSMAETRKPWLPIDVVRWVDEVTA